MEELLVGRGSAQAASWGMNMEELRFSEGSDHGALGGAASQEDDDSRGPCVASTATTSSSSPRCSSESPSSTSGAVLLRPEPKYKRRR